jgi:hypothetical protein
LHREVDEILLSLDVPLPGAELEKRPRSQKIARVDEEDLREKKYGVKAAARARAINLNCTVTELHRHIRLEVASVEGREVKQCVCVAAIPVAQQLFERARVGLNCRLRARCTSGRPHVSAATDSAPAVVIRVA